MSHSKPILHMLCGKIVSGKSTLATELARQDATALFSEDEWLSCLFGDGIHTLNDHVRYESNLSQFMGHI